MKLFEPITIRGLTIRNRIIMSPMGLNLGYKSRRMDDFYLARARGGVGAIIIGAVMPGFSPSIIERFKRMNDEIRQTGCKIGVQFYHSNRLPFTMDLFSGELIAPSAKTEGYPPRKFSINAGDTFRALTIPEIESIIERYAKAAADAKEAGFDFVEFHNAHGMLPCQFFSPTTNQRTDKYGGSLQNRMRFSLEVVQAMRAAVGKDFPITARQPGVDKVPDGFTIEEGIAFAQEMEKASIDLLNVSIGVPPFASGYIPAGDDPIGTFVDLAAGIKEHVNIPVSATGRIKDPQVAEKIISQGKADMVAIGRQMIADPNWAQKAMEGKVSDIAKCIDCHSCFEIALTSHVECSINYAAGREIEAEIKPAEKSKKVLVVGGGPAGMEAARVAAIRGHQVTLQEKSNQLGGAMILQSVIPSKQEVDNLKNYMSYQVAKEGVKIETDKEATPESVKTAKPDVVIFATGANSPTPDIRGINKEHVIKSTDVAKMMSGGFKKNEIAIRRGWRGMCVRLGSAVINRPLSLSTRKWLAGVGIPVIFGKRVVVIGAQMKACQLAHLLAENGRKVTVVTIEDKPATDMIFTLWYRLEKKMADLGIPIITGVKRYEEITDSGVVIINSKGVRETIAADTVVPMIDLKPDDAIFRKLKNVAPEVYFAGDFAEPSKLLHAIHDGARIGREIGSNKK